MDSIINSYNSFKAFCKIMSETLLNIYPIFPEDFYHSKFANSNYIFYLFIFFVFFILCMILVEIIWGKKLRKKRTGSFDVDDNTLLYGTLGFIPMVLLGGGTIIGCHMYYTVIKDYIIGASTMNKVGWIIGLSMGAPILGFAGFAAGFLFSKFYKLVKSAFKAYGFLLGSCMLILIAMFYYSIFAILLMYYSLGSFFFMVTAPFLGILSADVLIIVTIVRLY